MSETGKCKICNHPERDTIERLLYRGVSYSRIILAFPELNIANLSTHKNKHLAEKIHRKVVMEYEETTAKDAAEEIAEAIRHLDKIIIKGLEDLATGRVSARELIKAIDQKIGYLKGDKKKKMTAVDFAGTLRETYEQEDLKEDKALTIDIPSTPEPEKEEKAEVEAEAAAI